MLAEDKKGSSQLNCDSGKFAQIDDQNYLSQEKFEELLKTKQKMQVFIKKVQEEKMHLQSNIVFRFCGKYQAITISSSSILELLDKRIQRMAKNRRIKRNWSEGDIDILVWVLSNYAALNNVQQIQDMSAANWKEVSELICGTTGESCMFKILGLKKIKLSEQQWTQAQSDLLSKIVNKSQKIDWKEVSQQLFNKNTEPNKIYRNSKQCKQHWTCYLNPTLRKGPWTIQQDILLLEYIVQNLGKRKWAEMAKIFKGRTENALKNRYSLILEKQKSKNTEQNQFEKIKYVLQKLKQKELRLKIIKQNSSNLQKNQIYEQPQLHIQNGASAFSLKCQPCNKIMKEKNNNKQQKVQALAQNNGRQHSNGIRGFTLTSQNLYSSIIYPNNQFFMLFNV